MRKLALLRNQLLSRDLSSFIVQTEDKEHRRNLGHLLAILKPIPSQSAAPSPPHLAAVHQHPPIMSNVHQPPTMSNEDVLPEATGPVKTRAKTRAEPTFCQRSPTRKSIGPQAQLKPFLGGVTPKAACSNIHPSSNAPTPQSVVRSGRISRPDPKYKDLPSLTVANKGHI